MANWVLFHPRSLALLTSRINGFFLNLKDEIFKILKFGVVGVGSTVAHLGTLWVLISGGESYIILKNTVAFLLGFIVSFSGNYYWTFRNSSSPGQAIRRFSMVALIGYTTNTTLLYLFHKNPYFDIETTSIIIALAIAGMTFLLSRLWAFKRRA